MCGPYNCRLMPQQVTAETIQGVFKGKSHLDHTQVENNLFYFIFFFVFLKAQISFRLNVEMESQSSLSGL